MSMTATGRASASPPSPGTGAPAMRSGPPQLQGRHRPRALQRAAPPREAGVGHEIGMGGEGIRPRFDTTVGTVGLHLPALRLVVETGDHDLLHDLPPEDRKSTRLNSSH